MVVMSVVEVERGTVEWVPGFGLYGKAGGLLQETTRHEGLTLI